jgi:hypothetical protein
MTTWIISLCVTATLMIVGWTLTASLAARMKSWEKLEKNVVAQEATQAALMTRVSVLENKYDTIQATLLEIKVLLMKHLDKVA